MCTQVLHMNVLPFPLLTALEALCSRKEEELASKEQCIQGLQLKFAQGQELHRRQLEEMNIKMQQELYMAKNLKQKLK